MSSEYNDGLGDDRLSDPAAMDSSYGGQSPLTAAAPVRKVCCVCGENLVGKVRMKDGEGRYWCEACGTADSMKKHPLPCAECSTALPRNELVSYEGKQLCPGCANKRRQAAKREAARIAAAEAEAQRIREKRRLIAMAAGAAAAVLALWGVLMLLFR